MNHVTVILPRLAGDLAIDPRAVVDWFVGGGWTMAALTAVALALAYLVVERLLDIRAQARALRRTGIAVSAGPGVRGLRRMGLIRACVVVAPLLGLLGTVFGMIEAFTNISVGDALGKAELLASGIYQALVTTAAGLTVAIPSLVLYMVFTGRIERLVGDMDGLSLEFVETLMKEEDDAAAA